MSSSKSKAGVSKYARPGLKIYAFVSLVVLVITQVLFFAVWYEDLQVANQTASLMQSVAYPADLQSVLTNAEEKSLDDFLWGNTKMYVLDGIVTDVPQLRYADVVKAYKDTWAQDGTQYLRLLMWIDDPNSTPYYLRVRIEYPAGKCFFCIYNTTEPKFEANSLVRYTYPNFGQTILLNSMMHMMLSALVVVALTSLGSRIFHVRLSDWLVDRLR